MLARYRTEISPEASAEINEIADYFYTEVSPEAAEKVVRQLFVAIQSLEFLPHRSKVYQGRKSPALSVRVVISAPYLLYYRVNDGTHVVRILRVLHGAQRQPKRFR